MASAHDFTFTRLADDGDLALKDFAGKAILVVNVASACGYTSQYRDLEQLYAAKAKAGLVVLGAPCNDFGRQENGAEAEIRAFCDERYRVTFPLTGKIEILGPARHPFYRWIATELGEPFLPRWNFHKYLIGKDGTLRESFAPTVTPLSPQLVGAIEKALIA